MPHVRFYLPETGTGRIVYAQGVQYRFVATPMQHAGRMIARRPDDRSGLSVTLVNTLPGVPPARR